MPRVCIDKYVYLFVVLGIFLVPLKWLFSAIMAAFIHECCHLIAIYLLGGRILGFRIGAGGMIMELSPMNPVREALCALAGPLGSFALLSVSRWLPELALCALAQGLYNLLPVYPLDGGRVVRCLLIHFLPRKGIKLCTIIEMISCILLGFWGILLGMWPLVIIMIALIKAAYRKISCKEGNLAVQ